MLPPTTPNASGRRQDADVRHSAKTPRPCDFGHFGRCAVARQHQPQPQPKWIDRVVSELLPLLHWLIDRRLAFAPPLGALTPERKRNQRAWSRRASEALTHSRLAKPAAASQKAPEQLAASTSASGSAVANSWEQSEPRIPSRKGGCAPRHVGP